jgi:hypothetical protein
VSSDDDPTREDTVTEPIPSDTPVHDGREDVPELEYDETVPPRPEEEVADVARAVPDPAGHGEPELGSGDDARLHP